LSHLVASSCSLSPESMNCMPKLLTHLVVNRLFGSSLKHLPPSLQYLWCSLPSEGFRDLPKTVTSLHVQVDHLHSGSESWSVPTSVKDLSITFSKIIVQVDELQQLPSMTSCLKLHNCRIAEEAARHLQKLTQLTRLEIVYSSYGYVNEYITMLTLPSTIQTLLVTGTIQAELR
jgi:hypothetical protein